MQRYVCIIYAEPTPNLLAASLEKAAEPSEWETKTFLYPLSTTCYSHFTNYNWTIDNFFVILQCNWFSPLLRGVWGLRGNAVEFCDIARCCESLL